jgi:hypothetical protein
MPTRSRRITTDTGTAGDAVQDATTALEAAAHDVADNVPDLDLETLAAERRADSTARAVFRAPGTAVRTLVDDVAGAARRPDAVLTWVGLAGLAAVGVIEAPVAAVVGVAVAVAGGVRRARG